MASSRPAVASSCHSPSKRKPHSGDPAIELLAADFQYRQSASVSGIGPDAHGLARVSADLTSSSIPWRPAAHYVIGRPASAHTLADGVSAVAVRDVPAILAAPTPSG